MAITIHQQPAAQAAIGATNIIRATSTNSGNDGFMYRVIVSVNGIGNSFDVPANAYGNLIFNAFNSVRPSLYNMQFVDQIGLTQSVHAMSNEFISNTENVHTIDLYGGQALVNVNVYEGWVIDGIFTINEASLVSTQTFYYNYQANVQLGVNYDLIGQIGHQDGDQSRLMSDRDTDTHQWLMAESYGLNSNCIFVPTYESDWGVWDARCWSDEQDLSSVTQVRLAILPDVGAPVQQTYDISPNSNYMHFGFYPANLNASPITDIIKPSDYPNWKAIYFQMLNADDEIVSKTYVMYNAERDGGCQRFDKIRLAWVGRRGGWEYHNFTMKSDESFVTEKIVAQRVIGNYGSAGSSGSYGEAFSVPTWSESEVITDMKIQRFITAKSDWLTEGEFAFLKGLFLSKQVHWVQDDGSHIPVILEANGYNVKRQFNGGKLYDQEVKFKIAQEQFN